MVLMIGYFPEKSLALLANWVARERTRTGGNYVRLAVMGRRGANFLFLPLCRGTFWRHNSSPWHEGGMLC